MINKEQIIEIFEANSFLAKVYGIKTKIIDVANWDDVANQILFQLNQEKQKLNGAEEKTINPSTY